MADITVVPATVVTGAPFSSLALGKSGDALTAAAVVFYDDTTQTFKLADADAVTPASSKGIGFALTGSSAGQPVVVQKGGDLTIPGAALTPGDPYFLSSVPGKICPLADVGTGERVCQVGIAKSATVLGVAFSFPNVTK